MFLLCCVSTLSLRKRHHTRQLAAATEQPKMALRLTDLPQTATLNYGFFEERMAFSSGERRELGAEGSALPPLPRVWIGYLLGLATIIAELVAVSLHPELAKGSNIAKGEFVIPPLYLFLASFIGFVYWFVCVYQIHVVLAGVPGWNHPISPARAVGFHFIPVYFLYWVFKWPREIAVFVNGRLRRNVMKSAGIGVAILLALIMRFLDPGFGLILLFMPLSYVTRCLAYALAGAQPSAQNPPASPE